MKESNSISMFYIPDGHRRFAQQKNISLLDAYVLGYEVLLDQIIRPAIRSAHFHRLDIFLLSNLNLKRRDTADLNDLLKIGHVLLEKLVDETLPIAAVSTYGTYLSHNIKSSNSTLPLVNFYLGTSVDYNPGLEKVDIFIRSGGEMRLSGAPLSLIGDYTQFYSIEKLHPELTYQDIYSCYSRFCDRYMKETLA
jgi:undecaprenyl pyrophosphate synthase